MSLIGINKTKVWVSIYIDQLVFRRVLLSKSPNTSTAVRAIPWRNSLEIPEGEEHSSNHRISICVRAC